MGSDLKYIPSESFGANYFVQILHPNILFIVIFNVL